MKNKLMLTALLLVGTGLVACKQNTANSSPAMPNNSISIGAEKEYWDSDGKLKVLTIGNSFSDDTMEYFYQIADLVGVGDIELGNLYIGGCTLETHLNNARDNSPSYEYRTNYDGSWSTEFKYKMLDAVSSNDWDFISFQQASGYSGIESSYDYLEELMDIVEGYCISKNTRFVWNMTWAYQQNSSHGDFPKYDNSQTKMYQMITTTVQNKIVPNKRIEIISPTGTAIQNVRQSYIGDKLTRDGYHLSYNFGRYIAGCTFFSSLTGILPTMISYFPTGVDAQLKRAMTKMDLDVIQDAILFALDKPFEVTKSQYVAKTIDGVKYVQMPQSELGIVDCAFYNSSAEDDWYNLKYNDSISDNFLATRRFTKKELPVGSLIVIENGWKYRPEGWIAGNKNASENRPINVTEEKIIADVVWWGRYTERAFNISKASGGPLSKEEIEQGRECLEIYIPV